MCNGQACLQVRREGDRVTLTGTPPDVERFSTALLAEGSPWLHCDGQRIEVRASNRTVTYQVTDHPPGDRTPSDDEFVTARLIGEVPANAAQ